MATVRDFGARGDGKTDDTKALQHALQKCNGELVFPRGNYLVTRSLSVPFPKIGRLLITGQGGNARIVMRGAGPAFHLTGTHARTANPRHVTDKVWERERLPMVRDLEILGAHKQADGVRIDGAMQPTLQGLLIRRCRHAIHLTNRNRNLIVANCHIYDNRGIGIFFDRVNLHQAIIEGNHISYCRQGGIRLAGSEIRNLQICSNDIEYNHDLQAKASADVLFDCTNGTIREGTLTGNTIQAVRSPGGANVRFIGAKDHPNSVGLWAITGNLIGSQTSALHLASCRGIALSGNSIYSGYEHALLAENCDQLTIGANSIDHNPEYKGRSTDQILLRRCRNISMSGVLLQHTLEPATKVDSSIAFDGCQNINVVGCQIVNARTRGIAITSSSIVRVADCTIRGKSGDKSYRAAIDVDKRSTQLMIVNNFLGRGSAGEFKLPKKSGTATGNVTI